MSFISLVFGIGIKQSTMGAVSLDALLTEETELGNDVTQYVVEEGAPISDNITLKTEKLSISGVVSGAGILLLQGGGRSKLLTAKELIRAIHTQRIPVTIVTGMEVYDNMGMTNVRISRDNKSDRLQIDAQFLKIRVTTTRMADIPPEKTTAKGKAGATKTPAGKATPNNVDPNDGIKSSTLYDLIKGKPSSNAGAAP